MALMSDDDVFGSPASSGLMSDDDVFGAAPKKPSGIARRALGDTGISLLKGAIGVPEAAVGLADMVTGGYAGKVAEQAGFRPKEAKAFLDEQLTPEQQAANQYVHEGDGFMDTLKRGIERPSVIGQSVVESLPAMGAGGVAARGLVSAAKVAPWAAGAIGEGVVGAGSAAEQLRQGADDGLLGAKQTAASLASGAGTAAFGALGGKAAQKMGIADVDTALAGGVQQAAKGGIARRIGEGVVSEGVLEELPQSAWEQVAQNFGNDKPLDEGVGNAAALGLLSGAAMGGGFNAMQMPNKEPTKLPETGPMSRGVNAGIDSGATTLEPLALSYQAGSPLVTFPDGTTMTRAEYEQRMAAEDQQRLAGMEQDAPLVRMAERAKERAGEAADSQDLANLILSEKSDLDQRRQSLSDIATARQDKRAAREQQGSGSFADMNEFANLLGDERQDVEGRRAGIANTQALRREVETEDADTRVADQMAREAEQRRRSVLDSVLADPEVQNHAERFSADLKRQGFRDSAPTEAELMTVRRFNDVRNAEPESNVEPSLPNEVGAEQLGIKARQVPAPQAAGSRDKIAEVTQLVADGWKVKDRSLISPSGKRRSLNTAEHEAARAAFRAKNLAAMANYGKKNVAADIPTNTEAANVTETEPLAPQAEEANDAQAGVESRAAPQTEGVAPTAVPSDSSLNRTASWVVREKETGAVVLETFDKKKVDSLNTEKYEAVPIQEYLGSINGQPKQAPENRVKPLNQLVADELQAGRDNEESTDAIADGTEIKARGSNQERAPDVPSEVTDESRENRVSREAKADAAPVEAAENDAPSYKYVRANQVETPAQGVFAQAKEAKNTAWSRVKKLRAQVKDGRSDLRLELIKAEDAHKTALRNESAALEQIEKDANKQGLTTVKAAGDSETKFSFAGQSAETADQYSLETAQKRLKNKDNPETVRRETGWFIGVDGKWRFEISDDEAKLKNPPIYQSFENYFSQSEKEVYGEDFFPSSLNGKERDKYDAFRDEVEDQYNKLNGTRRLSDLLDHPKLFAAYPDLARMSVRFPGDATFRGAYYPQSDRIEVRLTEDREQMLSTLLHEIQHAIQEREGFATGGNAEKEFADSVKDALNNLDARSKNEVENWKWANKHKIDRAEEAAQKARYALMYDSAQRLIDYANKDKPSGVMRLIRNEMQWIYAEEFRKNEAMQNLQRDFYAIPKPSKMRERNAFLSDFAFKGARALLDHIPVELRDQFKNDPRTMRGMLDALRRESSKKSNDLKPLRELERTARDAQAVKEAHSFSTSFEVYQALSGEVEARNTQARQKMTDAERRNTPPQQTADVRADKIVVMFGGLDIQAPRTMASQDSQMARAHSGEHIPLEDLNAVAAGFRTAFPGIPVVTVEDETQLPKELREEIVKADAVGDVAGAYHEGQIYMIQNGIRDIEHAQHTIIHEGVHGGLKRIGVPDEILLDISKSNPKVQMDAYRIQAKYRYSLVRSIEESLADMGQAAQSLKGWAKLKAWVRGKLRKMGLVKDWSDADVDYLLTKSLQSLKTPASTTFYRGTAFAQNEWVTSEQSDTEDSDVKFSRAAQIIGNSGRQYDQAERDFFKNVGREINPESRIEKTLAYLKNDFFKKMAVGIVDQFRGLRDLNDNGQAYLLARLSKGTAGAFDALLHHGKLSLKDGVYDADTSGGFVERLGVPLNGELDDVLWWIAANRAEKLTAEGKENLFSAQDIAAGKGLAKGKTNFDYTIQTGPLKGKVTRERSMIYADANRVFNEFQKNALDMAEQSGLIDGASRKYWESEFYIPFYRVSEEDGEFIGAKMGNALVRQQAFKKLKGGTDKLNSDLLSNTLLNWSHLIEASAKNRAAKASLTAAEKVAAAQPVAANMGEYNASNGKMLPPGTKKTVWFMDNGQKKEYLVTDPFVMTAITSLEYAGMRNGVMDALTKFKHYLTVGVTASPAFKVRNLIRDSIQAIGTSDLGYNPVKNVVDGFKQTKRDSQEYVSALASGGLIRFGTMLEGSESARTRQLIRQGVKDSTILNSEGKWKDFYNQYIEPGIEAYNELGNRSEEINRAALYNQMIKQGKSHAEAALMARDLMDFSMQGAFPTIRFLSQVTPFFNARLQGMYKLGRAAKENPAKMAMVTGAVALAGMSLMLAYGDDDDWKKREDWDLNGFFWFKIGDTAFRIPRPFEIGAVASLAERSLQYMIDDEMTGERFRKVVGHLLMDNLSMNPTPQAIKPIVDLYANKDSFTGRPIETLAMEKVAPTERYTSNTSMVARGASKALMGAASPVQIDHLTRAYFGWLGSFVVGGADMAARAMSDEPTKPALDYFKFATQGIIQEANSPSSRYVTNVYDQAKELEQAYGTWRRMLKEGRTEDAKEYAEDNKDKLSRYKSVEAVKRTEAKYSEQIRQIERSDLDPAEKKTRIANINKMKDLASRKLTPGYAG